MIARTTSSPLHDLAQAFQALEHSHETVVRAARTYVLREGDHESVSRIGEAASARAAQGRDHACWRAEATHLDAPAEGMALAGSET